MYSETLPWQPNFDESQIPAYTLPELLRCQDGTPVTSVEEWENKRRPELLQLFKEVMYGELPPCPVKTEYELLSEKSGDLEGIALRREVRLHFTGSNDVHHSIDLLMYIPAQRHEKVPVFCGLTFFGNHVCRDDKSIRVTGLSYDASEEYRIKAENEMRGFQKRRFPLEDIIRRGYAVAFASYHDIFPDRGDGWKESIYKLSIPEEELQKRPAGYSAIGAWAWGLSRIADYVEKLPEIDSEKLIVYGHSRLGKSALWAGVCDERFKLLCVNDSGCGGAALSRRLYGETLFSMYHQNTFGNWWFTDTLKEKALHPEKLPLDQHELIALATPRSVAIHSASEDIWADPAGEYLSAYHAGAVSRLYGNDDILTSGVKPPNDSSAGGKHISYFIREGNHDILASDWKHYMDMADKLFASR